MAGRVEIIRIEAPEYAKQGESILIMVYATNWGDDDYCSIWVTTMPDIMERLPWKEFRRSGYTWSRGGAPMMPSEDVTIVARGGHYVGDTFVVDDTKTKVVKLSLAKLEITKVEVT
jgi:hypothetical protein